MPMELYWMDLSSPSRAVLMFAKHTGIDVKLKEVNLVTGEQNSPEIKLLNPLHQIPILDDNGFILTESRAMLQYLARAYGKDEYYPSEPKQQAIVHQRLFFDGCTLYPAFAGPYTGIFLKQQKPSESELENLDEKLDYLDKILSKSGYVAGDFVTIADFSIVASLSTFEACGHPLSKFSSLTKYLAKLKSEINHYSDSNEAGALAFGSFVKDAFQKL